MEKNENNEIILEFKKTKEGVEVIVYESSVLDAIVGIAETIQIIEEETGENKENILADINKALEILKKEEEK